MSLHKAASMALDIYNGAVISHFAASKGLELTEEEGLRIIRERALKLIEYVNTQLPASEPE